MSRWLIAGTIGLTVLLGVLVLRSDSRGDAPSKEAVSPADAPAKHAAETASTKSVQPLGRTAVERALNTPAEFNFADTPLKDVIAYIADHYKISVLLDARSLVDAGVTPDTTFTEKFAGVSLRSALHHLLAVKQLGCFEKDDNVLVVTTNDVASTRTTTQVYDIRRFANLVSEFSAEPKPWARLTEIITSTVDPASWEEFGGAGSLRILDGDMAVSQTEQGHSEIADLLSQLETARRLASGPRDRDLPVTLISASPSETRIERALDSRQGFDFSDTPLAQIVETIQSKLGIPVELDTKALADAGITAETKLSIHLKQVGAREGLRDLLNAADLDFIVDGEVLLITTVDVAKTKIVTYLYPVGDFARGADSETPPDDALRDLVDTIVGTVAPASWEPDGAASVFAFPPCKVLIITQTQPLHQQVKELMAKLRAARKDNPPASPTSTDSRVVRIYRISSAHPPTATDERRAEQLADIIKKLIDPKGWSDSDSYYIQATRGEVVVRQTPAVHRRIESLLEALDPAPPIKKKSTPIDAPQHTGISESDLK